MTAPTDTQIPYAPLPVRARGTLEIFDTAFKLFRRYAGVLLAWSALSGLINLIPVIGGFIYIFTMPLLYGAVSCVVAGAVRGQNVGFKQIWGFTKPRYGALLGVLILAGILLSVVMFVLMFGVALGVILLESAVSRFGTLATVLVWIIGTLGGLIGASFLLAVVMGWFNIAPIIACLEDGNRGSGALSRAWSLLAGNWRKASGVAAILALAGTAAFLIVAAFVLFFFYGGWDKFLGASTADSFLSGLALSGAGTLFCVAWTPIQAVVGAVFYLDLRTRKEALDLEWTNYAAKPETLPEQIQVPQLSPASPAFPQNGPPYVPASSLREQPSMAPQFSPAFNAQTPPIFNAQAPTIAPPQTSVFGAPPPNPAPTLDAQAPTTAPPPVPSEAHADFPAPLTQVTAQSNVVFAPAQMDAPASFDSFAAQVEAAPAPFVEARISPATEVRTPAPIQLPPAPQDAPTEVAAPDAMPQREVPAPPVSFFPAPEIAPASAANSSAPQEEPPSVPVPPAQPAATSSFAPPSRFRRAKSEDDDYPSSFGGGA